MYKSNPSNNNNNGIYISKIMLFAVILPIAIVILIGIGFLISYLTTPVESMIEKQTEKGADAVLAVDSNSIDDNISSTTVESAESVVEVKEPEEESEPEPTEQVEPQETEQPEPEPTAEVEEDDDDDKNSSSYGRLARTDNAGRAYYESLYYFGGVEIANLALHTGLPDDHVVALDKGCTTATALNDNVFLVGGGYRTGPEALEILKPRAVVVCFGRDGGTFMSVTTFKNYYRKLLVDIQDRLPNTQIIIMSVFPVTLAYERSEESRGRDEEFGPYNNEKIVEMNSALQDLAKELRVYYLAANGVLTYNDVYASPLDPKYCDVDGVRLNIAANEKIEDYIREHKLPYY